MPPPVDNRNIFYIDARDNRLIAGESTHCPGCLAPWDNLKTKNPEPVKHFLSFLSDKDVEMEIDFFDT